MKGIHGDCGRPTQKAQSEKEKEATGIVAPNSERKTQCKNGHDFGEALKNIN